MQDETKMNMLVLSSQDYPMTQEESEAFSERFHNGEVEMIYGSGPGTYEETENWADRELMRIRNRSGNDADI